MQEIYHKDGVYYGQNVISKNMIIANRRHLLNGNSFILGVSGAGKSFTAKEEMTNIILTDPNADVIIIDPEREYSPLVKAMQGEVIHISATSANHINAMDMNSDYGDGANPVILKSEFILSLCEQLIGGASLGAKQKSIIDRCTASVYRYYQQGNYMGTPPTLQDFREELLKQNEPEAQEIALAIELFTDGSLNTFACIIFSVFAASPPVVNPDAAAVSMVWSYIGELVFNMLVLVGAVKMADRVVREMMGL